MMVVTAATIVHDPAVAGRSTASAVQATCGKITEGYGGFTTGLQNDYNFGSAICVVGTTSTGGTLLAIGSSFHEGPGTTVCTPNANVARWGSFFRTHLNDTCWVEYDAQVSNGCPGNLQCDNEFFGSAIELLGAINIDGTDLYVIAVGSPGYEAPYKCQGGYTVCGDKSCREGAVRILYVYQSGFPHTRRIFSNDDGNSFSDAGKPWDTGVPIETPGNFGASLANLGDIDGPGPIHVAMAVGDPEHGGGTGAVWILTLDADYEVMDYRRIREEDALLDGGLTGAIEFGTALESLGDLDGYGGSAVALAVGAPLAVDSLTGFTTGAVWILFLDEAGDIMRYSRFPSAADGFEGVLADNKAFGGSLLKHPDRSDQLIVRRSQRLYVMDLDWQGRPVGYTVLTKGNTPELGNCLGSEQFAGALEWLPVEGGPPKLMIGTNGLDIQSQQTGAVRLIGDFFSVLPPVTAVEPSPPVRPPMLRAYPNPSIGVSTFQFDLDRGGRAVLEVYDVKGRVVDRIPMGHRFAGAGVFEWNSSGLVSGTYFVRLTVNGAVVANSKLVLLR